ncbi:hypothetical protein SRDD_05690 [Serratia sp. DD3]|nr:hypothetical protein SRDD_05690 [Serratia sp. DD3]
MKQLIGIYHDLKMIKFMLRLITWLSPVFIFFTVMTAMLYVILVDVKYGFEPYFMGKN